MRKLWTVLIALALMVSMAGLAGAEEPVFKIGVITSLSGDLAMGGNLTKRGYDMWAERRSMRKAALKWPVRNTW